MDVHARESGSPMRSSGPPLTKVGVQNSLRPAEVDGHYFDAGGTPSPYVPPLFLYAPDHSVASTSVITFFSVDWTLRDSRCWTLASRLRNSTSWVPQAIG